MPGFLTRLLAMLAAALSVFGATLPAQAHDLDGLGVVLLHGKGGTPTSMIEGLNHALTAEGALVEAPELPWSSRRIYDATYEQAMSEIDAAVERLKLRGAKSIAIIGHSLGANAAVGYAARRPGLYAVVAIAPGHLPEAWALRARTKGAIERAKSLIAAGQGDVRTSFPDLAQGIPFSIKATPNVYLSMFDPDGPAVMPKNAAAMEPVPFMWVVGIADPIIFHGKDYVFSLGAKNPKSKYMVTPSMHLSTPFQARGAIISWLKGL